MFPKEFDNSYVSLKAQLKNSQKAFTVCLHISTEHIYTNWESTSGIVEYWVDGKPRIRKSLKKGYTVGSEANIILGQEQDSFGGEFYVNQSLVGDIGDVNMWYFVLSPEEINTVYSGRTFSPNVLNW
ncbi:PREDICTED: C-reactive protein [Chrysochloris asiatica]|uniref:C-reactive protein n=1 Tax=Chrysochloris asiatica TaxID=185453 RepID=A0A9B0TD05_CHRAS|nr:PREDICTED: C-reactive protein [Chrysochloris asiatica]